MKFQYVRLGVALSVDEHDVSHPIKGNYISGVKVASGASAGRVLGLVQEHPCLRNVWCAVAATGDTFPAVDFSKGLWPMARGRSGFGSKREAAVWLLGTSDAQQPWFNKEN